MSEGPSLRDYRVNVPPGYSPTTPHALFFSFHTCGGDHSSASAATATALREQGVPTITVGPSSAYADLTGNGDALGPDGRKCWNLNTQWYDVAFVEALREHMLENYCIDTRNVFIHGRSSGGFAAQGIGCRIGATAIAAERGGIHHRNALLPDFPETPPPGSSACRGAVHAARSRPCSALHVTTTRSLTKSMRPSLERFGRRTTSARTRRPATLRRSRRSASPASTTVGVNASKVARRRS